MNVFLMLSLLHSMNCDCYRRWWYDYSLWWYDYSFL